MWSGVTFWSHGSSFLSTAYRHFFHTVSSADWGVGRLWACRSDSMWHLNTCQHWERTEKQMAVQCGRKDLMPDVLCDVQARRDKRTNHDVPRTHCSSCNISQVILFSVPMELCCHETQVKSGVSMKELTCSQFPTFTLHVGQNYTDLRLQSFRTNPVSAHVPIRFIACLFILTFNAEKSPVLRSTFCFSPPLFYIWFGLHQLSSKVLFWGLNRWVCISGGLVPSLSHGFLLMLKPKQWKRG